MLGESFVCLFLLFVTAAANDNNNYYYYLFSDTGKSGTENIIMMDKFVTQTILPEGNMTTLELVKNMGYKSEKHSVTTDDGYRLEIHRILPKNGFTDSKKLPVLLQHGLLGCSSCWVLNNPNQSLGFMLSDAGFDVWLSNVRGNPYGRSHKTYDTRSKQFWDFSFEEVAVHDLTAVIDFVLQTTNSTQINYVGHSMGTTMAFILLSTKPQYNNKINTVFALAPVAYLHHMRTRLVKFLTHFQTTIKTFVNAFKLYWLPPSDDYSPLVDYLCPPDNPLCSDLMGEIVGPNSKQFNQSRITVYIHQLTKLTSLRTLMHYAQIYTSEKFRRYDYGFFKNFIIYGRPTPPSYPVESITTPTMFYCGLNDYLSSIYDVDLLVQRLSHHVATFIAGDPKFNHLDFITGIQDSPIINKHIIDAMLGVRQSRTKLTNYV